MTHTETALPLQELKSTLKPNQEFSLPPKYYTFKRAEWYLLYDPANVTWVRVNGDGLKIVKALQKFNTLEMLTDHLAENFPYEFPEREEFRQRILDFLSYLIIAGFLHAGEYKNTDFPFFCQQVPTEVYLLMEYKCNLKCKYCYNESDRANYNTKSLDYLSFEEYARLVDEMFQMGIKKIIFTGGEPLLNPLTVDVAIYARRSGIGTELITNGQLVEKTDVEKMRDAFDIVTVSLDSKDPELHEKWRGKGTYTHTVHAIEKMKEKNIVVRVNSVICKHNVSSMVETWRYALGELEADYYTPALYTPTLGSDDELREMLPGSKELISEQKRVRSVFKDKIGVAFKSAAFRFSCGVANGEVSIGPDGGVFPCHTLHKPELLCGNIRDHGLQYVLQHSKIIEELKNFSVTDIEQCRNCDFKFLCGGGCLAMNYNMFGHFGKEKNVYCNYLKLEQIERMWTSTTLGLNSARTPNYASDGGI
ncbi:MAG: radical SAM protein [Acidobacteria bacterium]|nr:radical SAM protein [Acidobacteriota bacterium]